MTGKKFDLVRVKVPRLLAPAARKALKDGRSYEELHQLSSRLWEIMQKVPVDKAPHKELAEAQLKLMELLRGYLTVAAGVQGQL